VDRGSRPQFLSPTRSTCVLKFATTLPIIPWTSNSTLGQPHPRIQFPDSCVSLKLFISLTGTSTNCCTQASCLHSQEQQPQHQVVPSFLIFLACHLPGICRGIGQPWNIPGVPHQQAAWSSIRPRLGPGSWIFTTPDFVIAIAWNKSGCIQNQNEQMLMMHLPPLVCSEDVSSLSSSCQRTFWRSSHSRGLVSSPENSASTAF
jgi:hypothetical protein